MTNPHPELLEMIIRECAAAHPRPWYPAQLVPGTGVPQEKLEASLDQLRLGGLVRLTPWVQGHGQGYELTPYGTQVVEHPRLLQRLSSGEVPQAPAEAVAPSMERHALQNLRGEKIRNALVTDAQPIVTKMLLAANIIWFLVGLAVHTREGGTVGRYLTATDPDLGRTYDELGALALPYLADLSQWWRLVGYGFLHGGILHLLMNMYALFSIGPLMERMWGRAGFMALYLISCVGGGAAAVLLTPDHAVVGASGAICGLLGSMATWLFLNRAYLPPHIVANWQRSIISNVLLIALISMLPRVSWAGHLGGGVAGLIIAAPLNLAHFGEGEKKWLGWAAAILMTVVGLAGLHVKIAAMKQEFAHDPALDPTNKIMLKAKETANEALELAVEFLYGKAP
jgi:membrane associated rhomboid family serine protease